MKPNLLENPALKPLFYTIARTGLFMFGWKVKGRVPDLKKFILIAAPHSSNWDFVFFLMAIFYLKAPVNWMGKHTMFIRPFKGLLIRLGGIPINRTRKRNTVQAMTDEFNKSDRLILTIAPSGTRRQVTKWKTGFYRIAVEAGVPVACGFIDYKKKLVGIGPTVPTSGNLEADMSRILAFYKDIPGRYDK